MSETEWLDRCNRQLGDTWTDYEGEPPERPLLLQMPKPRPPDSPASHLEPGVPTAFGYGRLYERPSGFDIRCRDDQPALIKDLLKQIATQARTITEYRIKLGLEEECPKAGRRTKSTKA